MIENGRIREHLEGARRLLVSLPNVTGVGLGFKETRGFLTHTPAWRVYVGTKLPARDLPASDRVPPYCLGLATDVVAQGSAQAALGLGEEGPLAPGNTVSNLRGATGDRTEATPLASGLGTLGFFALVNGTRQRDVVLVSNRHVLLAHGAGCGDPIYRPVFSRRGEQTWVLRGDALDPVAEILDEGAESSHRFRYSGEPQAEYFVDCATARLVRDRQAGVHSTVRGIARLHPLDVLGRRAPRVHKLGGATGVTFGRVLDVCVPVTSARGERRLENIAIRGMGGDFIGPGDSGALVLNDREEAVGLIWGRNERGSAVAYASHIHPVLDRLDITLMPGERRLQ
jgi:hypothetical protein